METLSFITSRPGLIEFVSMVKVFWCAFAADVKSRHIFRTKGTHVQRCCYLNPMVFDVYLSKTLEGKSAITRTQHKNLHTQIKNARMQLKVALYFLKPGIHLGMT